MRRIPLIIVLSALIASCSSWPSVKKALEMPSGFCSDPDFNKKQTFIVYSYIGVPSGVALNKASDYVNYTNLYSDMTTAFLIKILSSRYLYTDIQGGTSVDNSKQFAAFIDDRYSNSTSRGGDRIAWIKDNIFITWDSSLFPAKGQSGFVLPNGESITDKAVTSESKVCEDFFGAHGKNNDSCYEWSDSQAILKVFDKHIRVNGCPYPHGCNETWRLNQGAYSVPEHGLFNFILQTGLNFGSFFDSHYFVVPERDRPALCEKAGLSKTCYEFDRESFFKFKEGISNIGDKSLYSAVSYLTRHSNITPFEVNQQQKILWESAFSLDLLINTATSVSKKMEGDWVTSQVIVDLSQVCKYARPTTEFYTH
ncbi:MAG: hypothetical protein JST80_10885 [Bdellovibrionales bacterium]|nr:hypothetical protein [Bdellovibrionales bacterium]